MPSPAARGSPHARRLRFAAVALLAAAPIVMTVANRSSPLLLALAAGAALAAAAAEGELWRLRDAGRAAARSALLAPLALAVLWAALSILWSPDPALSLRQAGEFAVPVAAGWVLAVLLPPHAGRRALALLLAGAALGFLLLALELFAGLSARTVFGLPVLPYLQNRPVLTLLLLLPPALLWWGRDGRGRALALAATLAVGALVLRSESGAGALGLAAAAAAFAAAWLDRRLALGLATGGLLAGLALAPVAGDIADSLVPARAHAALASSHSRDRVEIWQSFGAAVAAAPLAGQGFGASPRFAESGVAPRLEPVRARLLGVGHPHNGALQVWAELGAVGALLVAAALLLLLRGMGALPRARLAPRLALLAAAAAAAYVGHGIWQGWWAAALAGAVVWFRMVEGAQDDPRRGVGPAPGSADGPEPRPTPGAGAGGQEGRTAP